MYHLLFNPKSQLASQPLPQEEGSKWVALGLTGFGTIICFKISRKTGLIDSEANFL